MTFLVERLADITRHVRHLRDIAPKVTGAASLQSDLTLHNDVLFSLLVICQSVIDVAAELASRRGLRFQDYTEAVRGLSSVQGFRPDLVERLALLPGFRDILIHQYVELDYDRVIAALGGLSDIEAFVRIVAGIEAEGDR